MKYAIIAALISGLTVAALDRYVLRAPQIHVSSPLWHGLHAGLEEERQE